MNRSPSAAQPNSQRVLFTILLALVTLAVFGRAFAGEFVYDDLLLVKENTLIRSFGNLGDAFARPYWEGLDPDGSETVGLWRPLTTVALMVGHLVGSGSTFGFHLVSVLLHLAVAIAAASFARRLSQSSAIGLWTGILFALHPVHVESVAWISGVCDPLAGLFCLLTLIGHWTWLQSSREKLPWLSGLWFFLALLSKESAFATLPMLLALEFMPSENRERRFVGYAPVVVAFMLYVVARMLVFGELTGGFLTVTTQFDVPGSRLALLRVELLGGFMSLLAWPAELNLFRPFQPEYADGDSTLLLTSIWAAACLIIAVVLLVKKVRPGAVAWIFIPASLLPMLVRISALGIFPLADRYLYLAVFGFAFSLALLAWKKLPPPIATAVLAGIAVLYGWKSYDRTGDWSSESTLFARAVEQSPTSPYVAWSQGRVLLTRYKAQRRLEDLRAAKTEYERGTELLASAQQGDQTLFATKRDHLQMSLGLAWCYLYEGELDQYRDFQTPAKIFEAAAAKYPQSSNARIGFGIALMMCAENLEGQEKSQLYQTSGETLREALKLADTHEARSAMGQLMLRVGDPEAAVREFDRALAMRPGHLAYMLYLVQALEFVGEDARIQKLLTEANALYPDAGEPIRMQGSLAVRQNRMSDALRWFDLALEKDSNDGYAHLQRGIVLAQLDDSKEALKSVLRSCELAPGEFEPQYNAAVLLLKSDAPEKAREFLMRAYILRPEGTGNGPGSIGAMLSTEIRKLDPDDPGILWQLAEADRRLGETASALDWVDRSLKIMEANGAAHFTRAMLLSKDEESKPEAVEHLKRAAELLPENFDIQNELGNLLAEVGNHREAIDHLLAALRLLPTLGLEGPHRAQIHQILSHALQTSQAELEAQGN